MKKLLVIIATIMLTACTYIRQWDEPMLENGVLVGTVPMLEVHDVSVKASSVSNLLEILMKITQ